MLKSSVQKYKNNDFNKHNISKKKNTNRSQYHYRLLRASLRVPHHFKQDIWNYFELHEKKEKKEKHPNFELNVITTSVINTFESGGFFVKMSFGGGGLFGKGG